MIARLNLASDPFRNRTLPWTVAAAVSAVSVVALVLTLAAYREESAKAEAMQREVNALSEQSKDLNRQAEEVKRSIPAEQAKTLEAAHALVSRKGFSWSQLFSDLEEAMPSGVRVQRINVREVAQVGDQTRADLEVTVLGRAATDVTGMIIDMNTGGTFNAVPVTETQKTGRGESGYEWVLRVSYVQRRRRAAEQQPARGQVGAAAETGGDAGGRD